MSSCLYEGNVRHRRFKPKPHDFSSNLFYTFFDLDELDSLFNKRWLWSKEKWNLVSFRRKDYFGDANIPLKEAVLNRVEEEIGYRPQGAVKLFTHLRFFGFVFNPVSFYFCYDKDNVNVEVIVAEITNTPWDERHVYVLPTNQKESGQSKFHFRFEKRFHVSPFMPMNIHYHWYFTTPEDHLTIHMVNFQDDENIFDATLSMKRKAMNAKNCASALLRFPFITFKVIGLIYWHALRLFLKKVPFLSHPETKQHNHSKGGSSHEQ